MQIGKISENAFELLDSVVDHGVLRCLSVVDEALQERLVANKHVDKVLVKVLALELPAVQVEEQRAPDGEL